jgi:hypothetical protein
MDHKEAAWHLIEHVGGSVACQQFLTLMSENRIDALGGWVSQWVHVHSKTCDTARQRASNKAHR